MGITNLKHRRHFLIINSKCIFISCGICIPLRRIDQRRRHPRNSIKLFPTSGKIGQRLHQPPCIGMSWIIINFFRCTNFHDFSRIHNCHTVCCPCYHTKIMGYQNSRCSKFFLDFPKKIQNLCLNGYIQGSGRFIRKQNIRIRCQGNCHNASLPHTAGKMIGISMISFLRPFNSYQFHQLDYFFVNLIFCFFPVVN